MEWRKIKGRGGYPTHVLETPEGTTKLQRKPLGRNLGYGWVATFPDKRTFTSDSFDEAQKGAERHLQRERDKAGSKPLAQHNAPLEQLLVTWDQLHAAIQLVQTSLPTRMSYSIHELDMARMRMCDEMNRYVRSLPKEPT